jgi:hypothetical protein
MNNDDLNATEAAFYLRHNIHKLVRDCERQQPHKGALYAHNGRLLRFIGWHSRSRPDERGPFFRFCDDAAVAHARRMGASIDDWTPQVGSWGAMGRRRLVHTAGALTHV